MEIDHCDGCYPASGALCVDCSLDKWVRQAVRRTLLVGLLLIVIYVGFVLGRS